MVGLGGDEKKFPGEISGGMRKRAGLARSLVLDPQIILCDEPDSGLDPVRTAYLSQLLIDINAQIDCTILIVTHNINIARTVPDNMGMLFRTHAGHVRPARGAADQRRAGGQAVPQRPPYRPDRHVGGKGRVARWPRSRPLVDAGHHDGGTEEIEGVPPQITATPGMPERKAGSRRQARVREILHTLPKDAQEAILESFENDKQENSKNREYDARASRHRDEDPDTASIPTQRSY